ncbi:protein-lysine N-methyltransferase EEF2KMT isoform X1 [Eumetopias jubatus]|uniref:protein-lysine N-methyltransferase EEF2KMT isoform X1 n=1 Tax=Eumetopias jubatus TaxID=34886 RepID=UPI001015DC1A|nr:protein-lysine N-methyltransferase EEF2KMT isoform X1 [Eumetopias jubatus]
MAPEEIAEAESVLQSFERRFLAARTLRSFPWQSLEEKLRDSSGPELLLNILQKTVKHPLCVKHPPSVKYVRCFLSELIRKHEAVHMEPLDELYEALAEVLMAEEPTQCHRSYLLSCHFEKVRWMESHNVCPSEIGFLCAALTPLRPIQPSGDSVTLSESTAIVSHGTTGLVTWDAALYLAEWAIENPAAFAHRTVLELGSGAGLTGLAICKTCCPSTYVFSDCHSCVLEQLRGNILLNGLSLEPDTTDPERHPGHNAHDTESPRVTVAQLDWDVVTAPELAAFRPDVIIAADVLYCPETVMSLVRVLQRLSACLKDQQAPEAYIAFTVRSPETCWLFTNELGQTGIPWEAVPHHNQKLFPYEEHLDMAILKLIL